eukprot:1254474-Pleurochrysis_carterae.AAC.1
MPVVRAWHSLSCRPRDSNRQLQQPWDSARRQAGSGTAQGAGTAQWAKAAGHSARRQQVNGTAQSARRRGTAQGAR